MQRFRDSCGFETLVHAGWVGGRDPGESPVFVETPGSRQHVELC